MKNSKFKFEYLIKLIMTSVDNINKIVKLGNVLLCHSDNREILKLLPDNSIDSVVTDGPYHLSDSKNNKKGYMGQSWDAGSISFDVSLWSEVYRVTKPGTLILAFAHPRTYHRLACAIEDAGFQIVTSIVWLYGQGMSFQQNLRNLHEVIVVAQKPCKGSKKANIQEWGTGAYNFDKCKFGRKKRCPSNVIVSESVAKELKEKGAYYYCPKPTIAERNAGCEHLKAKPQNSNGRSRTFNDRCANCGKKFIGSKQTICHCPPGVKKTDKTVYKNKNNHPTVKPVKLMEYLLKLVTPNGGICLDLFGGVASTGLACVNLGYNCILIEKEKEYFKIAEARMLHAQKAKGKAA